MSDDDALSYDARSLRNYWLDDRKGRVRDVSEILDCDEWRRNYDTWSVADHKKFYAAVWASYPNQSHSAPDLTAMVMEAHRPTSVIEIGGWDGELAIRMLEQFDFITSWTNVEICEEAVDQGHYHPRYFPISPNTWYWENVWKADMLVASHCIEHMPARDVAALVRTSDVKYMCFDAPLVDGPTSWWGSSTTHILEVGWDGVTDIAAQHGFELTMAMPHITPPESGGHARMCVYTRVPGVLAA